MLSGGSVRSRSRARDGAALRAAVLPSKVSPPRLPPLLVARPRLLAHAATATGIRALWGPAGSGKSTALAEEAQRLHAEGAVVAWLTLDAQDNDPYLFWSSVIQAWQEGARRQDLPVDRLAALAAPREMSTAAIAALNLALESLDRRLCLVADDLQVLRAGPVLDGLAGWLEAGPPGLTCLAAGRWRPPLPWSRWESEGWCSARRVADLAFTTGEADELLGLHEIDLDDDARALLLHKTEGWAAGLRLAAMSLRHQPDPGAFVDAFTGADTAVADYLVSEVLATCDTADLEFLLATAVPEQLSVELAATMTQRPDAGGVLDRLVAENALVTRIDTSPVSYRYHALLRGYLLGELARRDVAERGRQHRVAATWWREQGFLARALLHLRLAEDWPAVADLLDETGVALVLRGETSVVSQALAALPPDVAAQPSLTLLGALRALLEGEPAEVAYRLSETQRGPVTEDARQRVLAAVVELGLDRMQGKAMDVDQLMLRAREEAQDAEVDVLADYARSMSLFQLGRFEEAEHGLRSARDLAQVLGLDYLVLQCQAYLSMTAAATSRYNEMAARALEAVAFADDHGWTRSPGLLPALAVGGWAAWARLDLAAAERLVTRAMTIEGTMEPGVRLSLRLVRAYSAFDRGGDVPRLIRDAQSAWNACDLDTLPSPAVGPFCLHELRVALDHGLPRWVTTIMARADRNLKEHPDLLVVRALAVMARSPGTARRLLQPILEEQVATTANSEVTAWILDAEIAARRQEARSHRSLVQALEIAEPLGLLRPFAEAPWTLMTLNLSRGRFGSHEGFVDELLAAAAPWRPAEASGAAALTPRQLEILRDLPSNFTSEQIAAAHHVSMNTLKTHLRGIYAALEVPNRRGAVEEGRRRGLI